MDRNDQRFLYSRMGWSTETDIFVRGYNLTKDLVGTINLGDMLFLEVTGRLPNPDESRLINAISIVLVEHGVTPSSIAARLTYLGAPEALQGAIAAGLLGIGTVFVGTMEGAARMLQEALAGNRSRGADHGPD
ncbi:MAG: citryl-CoA lyase, partial [Clostridia bacterium]|nr:citryl-CoA lyase [Clostridia bacterium]